jgi:tetratricopeptide (TPR) repeat protein
LREYEEALECFEKALELNPENNSVWKIKLYATLHLGLKKR